MSTHCRTVFLVPKQLGAVVIPEPPPGSDLPVMPSNFIITPIEESTDSAIATWDIIN